MKKNILLVLLICVISSCSLFKNSESSKIEKNNLVGLWSEHWGTDKLNPETDIDYVDTIKVELNRNGKFVMRCINRSNYIYRNIKSQDNKLSFEMENTEDKNEKFTLQYSFFLLNKNLYNGEMLNSRGSKASIQLRRILKE